MTERTRYDRIGNGDAARSVVDVGAGAGSYEPRDRQVIAIEPKAVMAAQRPPELSPAARAFAGAERGVRERRRCARSPHVTSGCGWWSRDRPDQLLLTDFV
jgi:hypothetical protein